MGRYISGGEMYLLFGALSMFSSNKALTNTKKYGMIKLLNKEGIFHMRQLSVGVLAGGKNTGEHLNDILYQLNNRRYMKRLMGELGIFTEMLISDAKMGNFEELGPRVVYDAYGDIGPIDGICQILRQVSSPYVFVCAVDMPFISIDLVEYLAGYISEEYDCYVLADEERVHPLCAIYSKEVLPIIEELIAAGHYRLTDIFRRTRTRYIGWPELGVNRKAVRNMHVRQRRRHVRERDHYPAKELPELRKSFLIIRVINGFIADITPKEIKSTKNGL